MLSGLFNSRSLSFSGLIGLYLVHTSLDLRFLFPSCYLSLSVFEMGKVKTAAALLAAATSVAAHGHVPWVVVNGVAWQGYDVNSMPYQNSPPTVVGWSSSNVDNGFVEPVNFGTSDVICHRDSGNAKGYIPVNAGDYITFLWTVWPESHLVCAAILLKHGPVSFFFP